MFPKFYYEFLGTSAALGTLPRVKAKNLFSVMKISTCIRVSFLWWLHICFFCTFSAHVALREDVPTGGRFLDGKSNGGGRQKVRNWRFRLSARSDLVREWRFWVCAAIL